MEFPFFLIVLATALAGLPLVVLAARAGCYLGQRSLYRACERALADEEVLLGLLLRRGPDAAPGTREAFLTALRSAVGQTRALRGEWREAAERRQASLMCRVSARAAARGR